LLAKLGVDEKKAMGRLTDLFTNQVESSAMIVETAIILKDC
jgi:hypothetical protein